jgi:hypothetical protein
MAKYYMIRGASDPKIIGVKGGREQAVIDRDGFRNKVNYDNFVQFFFSAGSMLKREHIRSFPDFNVDLECVRLAKGAKLTHFMDYMPCVYNGGNFLINEQILQVITSHNLPDHRIYDVNLEGVSAPKYRLLYCPPLSYDTIDFNRTRFSTGNRLSGKKIFPLKDAAEFEALKEENLFSVEEIAFSDKFDAQLDYFMTMLTFEIFISERLKLALDRVGITGLNIIEPLDPYLRM